jgi:hypothetical protein
LTRASWPILGVCLLSACAGGSPTAPTAGALADRSHTLSVTAAATDSIAIGGTVTDREMRTPIEGVTVSISDPPGDAGITTTTGSDGTYRLSGIKSTRFTVQFAHEGYLPYSFEYSFRLGTERFDLITQLAPNALLPGEPKFTFDPEVSALDQEVIREGIRLAQDYLPPAVGRGVVATTHIFATVNASTRPGTTAMAGGHRIDVYVNSQGWQTSTSIKKRKIMVHEYFHVLQGEVGWPGMANTEGARWLLEGAAEYVGYRAIIDTGLVSYATVRNCQMANVAGGTPLAPLAALEGQGFTDASGPTYPLAWLATEKASQRNLGTLGLFWMSGDGWRNKFHAAFGVDLEQFYTAFEAERRDYRTGQTGCNF